MPLAQYLAEPHGDLLHARPLRTARRPLRYSVSFEFDYRPVLTHTGTVEASRIGTGARMAIEEAAEALHPARWRSLVVVLTGDDKDRGC